MLEVPKSRRTARFRAAIVVVMADGRLLEEAGTCEGVIATSAAGSGGFGYDPLFVIPERSVTMAELSAEEKNVVSHRGVAARKMAARLRDIAGSG
jgi:XTP/dITP diphosphohydrolase